MYIWPSPSNGHCGSGRLSRSAILMRSSLSRPPTKLTPRKASKVPAARPVSKNWNFVVVASCVLRPGSHNIWVTWQPSIVNYSGHICYVNYVQSIKKTRKDKPQRQTEFAYSCAVGIKKFRNRVKWTPEIRMLPNAFFSSPFILKGSPQQQQKSYSEQKQICTT